MGKPKVETTDMSVIANEATHPKPPQRKGNVALTVKDLRVYYGTDAGTLKAVDGVSFTLSRGERIAFVGESGSGKSTMAMALLRLIRPPGYVADGEITLNGTNLLNLSEKEMRLIRLADIALVPQGAMNSLNPVRKVKHHILDGLEDHGHKIKKGELGKRIQDLLEGVGLSSQVSNMFPHELSGGMKQRVAMAMATSLQPSVIVADEPTSALDVVVQKQVMKTLRNLQEKINAGVILVGHDMGLVVQFANRVGVMYAGKLVEMGAVRDIIRNPLHPYTKLLVSSLPTLTRKHALTGIPGLPPTLINLPEGCSFSPRCPSAFDRCRKETPEWIRTAQGGNVACHLVEENVTA